MFFYFFLIFLPAHLLNNTKNTSQHVICHKRSSMELHLLASQAGGYPANTIRSFRLCHPPDRVSFEAPSQMPSCFPVAPPSRDTRFRMQRGACVSFHGRLARLHSSRR